jgi:hypothetical protein
MASQKMGIPQPPSIPETIAIESITKMIQTNNGGTQVFTIDCEVQLDSKIVHGHENRSEVFHVAGLPVRLVMMESKKEKKSGRNTSSPVKYEEYYGVGLVKVNSSGDKLSWPKHQSVDEIKFTLRQSQHECWDCSDNCQKTRQHLDVFGKQVSNGGGLYSSIEKFITPSQLKKYKSEVSKWSDEEGTIQLRVRIAFAKSRVPTEAWLPQLPPAEDTEPACSLTDALSNLLHDNTGDVTFHLLNGEKSVAHSFVLSLRSDVFKAMFSGTMQESQTKVSSIDHTKHVFDEFLKYLYTDKCFMKKQTYGKNETFQPPPESLVELYVMADYYNVPCLLKKCRKKIISAVVKNMGCGGTQETDRLALLGEMYRSLE